MAEKQFTAGYTNPANPETGINGGNEFARSDAMFAEDVNKIVGNQMHLKETKADLASPNLTGQPAAPTAASTTKSTQIATTAFVHNVIDGRVGSSVPKMDGTAASGTTVSFAREDHVHPSDTAKVTANNPITGGTKCKITYDAKGLVTAGADLAAADVPSLDAGKITSGSIPVARGGTGAADAATARANLGAAASGHTHTKTQITDFPTSMPASDVSAWAKAGSKPAYTASEVGLGNVQNVDQTNAGNITSGALNNTRLSDGLVVAGNNVTVSKNATTGAYTVSASSGPELSLYANSYSFTTGDKTPQWANFTLIERVNRTGQTSQTLFNALNQLTGFRVECTGISLEGFATTLLEINPTGANTGWFIRGFRGGGSFPWELHGRRKQVGIQNITGQANSSANFFVSPYYITCVGRRI